MPDLVEGWTHLVNEYEAETLFRLLRTVFADQYVIVKRSAEKDRLQFKEFGDRMFSRYDTWRSCAVGAPIEEQPDREYGRWIGTSYREALTRNTPQLETIDAVFRCPEKGRFRRRYRRMIFPINSQSTGQLLFGGSFDDPTIDLRVQAP